MSSVSTRQEALTTCSQLTEADFRPEADVLGQRIERQGGARWMAYRELGHYAFDVLTQHPRIAASPLIIRAARGGTDVLGRLLSFAPDAYRDYCQEYALSLNLEQLRQTLRQSGETARRFQDLPDATNTAVEEAFELRAYDSGFSSPYLRFEDTEEGLCFVADDEHFSSHTQKPAYRNDLPKQLQRCMAIELVAKVCWPGMVDLATDTPEVFAHDLGLANNTRRNAPTHGGALAVFQCAE